MASQIDEFFEVTLAGTVKVRVPNSIPRCIDCRFLAPDKRHATAMRFSKCTHPSALNKSDTLSEILTTNDVHNYLDHFRYASVQRQELTAADGWARCGTHARHFELLPEKPALIEEGHRDITLATFLSRVKKRFTRSKA